MIIYNDVAKAVQTKREIKTLIEHLNKHLADFSNSGFPPVKTEKDLKIFAHDPEKYFLDQAEKQAKNRNMEGSDPAEYARLFGHSFAPDLKSYPIGDLTLLDYLRLDHGEVVSVEDIEQRLEDSSIIKTQNPEEAAAARLLFKLYSEFSYVITLLSVGTTGMLQTGAARQLGFHPFQVGQLSPDTVRRLAEQMKELSLDEFNEKLIEQSVNPGLNEIIKEQPPVT